MNVDLTLELERLIEAKVQSGRYHSASEVVREALRMLEAKDESREVKVRELRGHMDRAIAECERGETVDGEAFMSEMIADLDRRERLGTIRVGWDEKARLGRG